MVFGIVSVMKIYMVAKEFTTHRMMAELEVHQRLPKRYDQMRSNDNDEI